MDTTQSINGNIPFVVYFSLSEEKTDAEIAEHIEDYMGWGKNQFTLSSDLMQELIDHEERVKAVKGIYEKHGATCRCAHSTWGEGNELSLPFDGDRKRMLRLAERQLELAATFGADTCAFHAETWSNDSLRPHTAEQWRSYINDSLEKLLPIAERYNVIIALENIWSQMAMPEELCGFVERFNSSYLGLCFDIGHANVLAASGTRSCSWMPWACKDFGTIPWDDDVLDKMLPHIVTAHLHDNATDTDSHDIPGHGNIDWETNMTKLMKAPRLRSLQHEIAQSFHYPAKTILDAFAAKGIR
ncbi:MAG: sugar phosphate isomerase/epimerase [Victivallales bacterium]|nr:sugar phosphate isomerase/epimerase [Victivallales bacterium]